MTPETAPTLYRLADRADWEAALEAGRYEGAEIDFKDGYIHLSTAAQVRETARLHYRGRRNAMLLAVDAGAVAPHLRWEPSRGGDLFPHLYAHLPVSAVKFAEPLALDGDGVLVIPDALLEGGS